MLRRFLVHPHLSCCFVNSTATSSHQQQQIRNESSSPPRRVRVVVRKQETSSVVPNTDTNNNDEKASPETSSSTTTRIMMTSPPKPPPQQQKQQPAQEDEYSKNNILANTSASDLTRMSDQNLDQIWSQFASASSGTQLRHNNNNQQEGDENYYDDEGFFPEQNNRNHHHNRHNPKSKQQHAHHRISNEVARFQKEITKSSSSASWSGPSDVVFGDLRNKSRIENAEFQKKESEKLPLLRVVKRKGGNELNSSSVSVVETQKQPQQTPPRIPQANHIHHNNSKTGGGFPPPAATDAESSSVASSVSPLWDKFYSNNSSSGTSNWNQNSKHKKK